jgi:hypothetical protein
MDVGLPRREHLDRADPDHHGAAPPEGAAGHPLRIYVVATTDTGTRLALGAAHTFAAGFPATIYLLVPHAIPYPQPLDCRSAVEFAADRFRDAAAACAANVMIQVCVCRPGAAALIPAVPPNAIVVLGGTRGVWRRSREERLAAALIGSGRRVLLVDY